MIPWLLVAELVSVKGQTLGQLVQDRIAAYPSSGEINIKLSNPESSIEGVKQNYSSQATLVDYTDGISIEFPEWRFNLRSSNTEPVVRLNVESRNNKILMEEKVKEILNLLSL
jgi:phosphomannomutase